MRTEVIRAAILVALGLPAGLAGSAGSLRAESPPCEGTVVFRSGSEAYDAAVAGMKEALAASPCRIQYLDLANPAMEKLVTGVLAVPKPVAAVGAGAYERVQSAATPGQTIIPAVILRDDLKSAGGLRPAAAIYADVPLLTILEHLRGLFPKKSRVGLIRRPSRLQLDAAASARIRQMGYELRVVECDKPDKLLAAFTSLKGAVDFVIAEPDPELYNSATVKPLVLASFDQRLPIVGFSAGFVRAGALVGIYPDFRELGRQTGQRFGQILLGKMPLPEEDSPKVAVAVNQRIVRLLGIEPAPLDGVEVFK